MSWYSKIYVRVRNYRREHPFLGWFLTRCLNFLLVIQVIGHMYSFYVYVIHFCGHFLTSSIQATIYICIYFSLSLMALWCLFTTISWPVKRVPDKWKVTQETCDELKKMTPKNGERYLVDKSSPAETKQQIKILKRAAASLGCLQAECDQAGRLKFCYECGHLKPDRTHHCSSCGFCVVRFDHHCPWINHCVNYNNYKFFVLYLFYAVLVIVWFLLGSLEAFIRFLVQQQWEEDWPSLLVIASVVIPFSVFGYYPLGELLFYHLDLASINETTCEQAKPALLRNDFTADYNQGRWENLRQVLGWGLWFVPLPTQIEDGMHFVIRYENAANLKRFRRIELVEKKRDEEMPKQVTESTRNTGSKIGTTATRGSAQPSVIEGQKGS